MKTYSPDGSRVRLSSAIFFILSIIGFFIWSDSGSLRALFGSLFVLFVGIYLLLKSFDQSEIFITTFPSEISGGKDFIEVLPETEKVDGLYVSYKLKNEDAFYSNWPYYRTKDRSLYLLLPVLVVENR